jgi:hypothetical protein
MSARWAASDRISDEITALVNRRLRADAASPLEILAGLCLGLAGYLRSAPAPMPASLQDLNDAVDACLNDLLRNAAR